MNYEILFFGTLSERDWRERGEFSVENIAEGGKKIVFCNSRYMRVTRLRPARRDFGWVLKNVIKIDFEHFWDLFTPLTVIYCG